MPLFPQYFFLVASATSAISSVANIAQISARARIMSSFARRGNLADCVRAGQTQSKLTSLLGTASGAAISWFVGADPLKVMACMVPLAAVSTFAIYKSSEVVVLRALNVQRAERVFLPLIVQIGRDPAAALEAPTPEEVAAAETFVRPCAAATRRHVPAPRRRRHSAPTLVTPSSLQRYHPHALSTAPQLRPADSQPVEAAAAARCAARLAAAAQNLRWRRSDQPRSRRGRRA